MAIGPVEYLVIGFPTDQVDADCVPALADLVDSGTIRILDLAFVAKDADGNMRFFEYDTLDPSVAAAFGELEGEADGLFSDEDLEIAAAALERGTSAALLLWEDVWATRFAEALRASGGQIIDGARIPHDLIEAALAYAAEAG
jgi:uncharacterized membrane protein